jgi:hypothetical protein
MESFFYSLIPFLPFVLHHLRLSYPELGPILYSTAVLYCWDFFITTLHGPHRKQALSCWGVFTVGTCLPSRCLTMGIHITILLFFLCLSLPSSLFHSGFPNKILSLSLILRPTVSRPICLGIKQPSGAYDQIFITVRELRVCWYGAFSLTRGRVCRLQLLLALANAVIFGSESRGTRDHILPSQIRDFLISSPPTTRRATVEVFDPASTCIFHIITPQHGPRRKHRSLL